MVSSKGDNPKVPNTNLKTSLNQFCLFPELAKITEARIMKDLKNGGQSKGYAFIAFESHESALNALRKLVRALHKIDRVRLKPLQHFE